MLCILAFDIHYKNCIDFIGLIIFKGKLVYFPYIDIVLPVVDLSTSDILIFENFVKARMAELCEKRRPKMRKDRPKAG